VRDELPPALTGFTGRAAEVSRIRQEIDGDTAVVCAIEGMAGVGKTELAVHTAHTFVRELRFDRVLFVNLRGFHPDPGQPPADPSAVLEGFLRLLGVPGQAIPHDLDSRCAAYRERIGRAVVVLDNAAGAEQARPLLPRTPGSLTLITSRRDLSGLGPVTALAVDVFSAAEARQFLARATAGVPVGDDPHAVTRISDRCGLLPLALGLVAMRAPL
jgi:predicted ATPase